MKSCIQNYKKRNISIRCERCGSKNVRRDADAAWNETNQTWELVAVYDHATCEECGGETTLEKKIIEC